MGGVTVILYPQSVPPTGTLGGAGVRMGRSWTLVQGTDGGTCSPPSGGGDRGQYYGYFPWLQVTYKKVSITFKEVIQSFVGKNIVNVLDFLLILQKKIKTT